VNAPPLAGKLTTIRAVMKDKRPAAFLPIEMAKPMFSTGGGTGAADP
jgi:hypothetical protein